MIANVFVNMRIARRAFNPYFLATGLLLSALTWAGAAGASDASTARKKSTKSSETLAVIRIYAETTDDGTAPKAQVIRSLPQTFAIMKQPFWDERDVTRAGVLETPDGGFMIQIDGTSHAKQALEMTTVTSNGRHLVIFSQWSLDDSEKPEERWLAAPLIRGPLHDGTIVFSADCTREEALRIVDGLNNVAVKLKNQPKTKSSTSSKKEDKSKPPSSPNSTAGDLIDKYKK